MSLDFDNFLRDLEVGVNSIPRESIPPLLGDLERVRAALWARMMGAPPNGHRQEEPPTEGDRLLTPEEAARALNVKVSWLYRNGKRLPFTRRLSRKCLRFSEAGLRRWQAAKRA